MAWWMFWRRPLEREMVANAVDEIARYCQERGAKFGCYFLPTLKSPQAEEQCNESAITVSTMELAAFTLAIEHHGKIDGHCAQISFRATDRSRIVIQTVVPTSSPTTLVAVLKNGSFDKAMSRELNELISRRTGM